MNICSETIETIRKESVFSEEVTESEMEVIQKRVAFQQRQFAQYERREKMRKSSKIRAMYDYISDEEIDEMLLDCGNDEVRPVSIWTIQIIAFSLNQLKIACQFVGRNYCSFDTT